MKKISVVLMVLAFGVSFATAVGAGESEEVAGGYWKVTGAWHFCSAEGVAGKMIAITDYLESGKGVKFFYPAGAEGWDRVKKLRAEDLVWVAMTNDLQIRIDLNRQPPASMELGRDLLK